MTSTIIEREQTAKEAGRLSRWERMTLASGIIAGTLFVAAMTIFIVFVAPEMPPFDAPPEEFAAFMLEQSRGVTYALIPYLGAAQMTFALLFFGGLSGVLRRAEGGGSLAAAVFAAGLAVAVVSPVVNMIETHLLFGFARGGVDPAAIQAVDGLFPVSLALSSFPQAVVLGGTATLLLNRRFAPRWLGWAGLVLGGLVLVGTGTMVAGPSLFPITALGTLLFWFWVLALSIALLRRAPAASAPTSMATTSSE